MGSTKIDRTIDPYLYCIWKGIRQRCYNPNNKRYHRYGGRGIKICDRWADFTLFKLDVGPRPGINYSLDRIDNNKDYEPFNIRWATAKEQARNRVDTRILSFNGKTQSLKTHCEDLQISYNMAKFRLRRGWKVEDIFTIPKYSIKNYHGAV